MAKEIVLKTLSLRNFKGKKELNINFSKITNIYGENGTGKTSIFDAFTWLLFDKDSQDRSKFDIQPLDEHGNVVHMIETEVEGVLELDGKTLTLKKVLKEKWTRKRGEEQSELKGTETSYYIDETPVKMSEYKAKISELIDENIFKLITNPLYFSLNMKWQDRRKVLLEIIGDVTADRIINYKSSLRPLEALLVDKDIDTLKRSIQARRRKLNDEIKSIPPRIDELNNSIQDLNFDALDLQRRGVVAAIRDVEERILDKSKVNEALLKEKNVLYSLKESLRELEYKLKLEAEDPVKQLRLDMQKTESELYIKKSSFDRMENDIKSQETEIVTLENKMDELRNKWSSVNDEVLTFNDEDFVCPTCRRPFEANDIESKKQEMIENFNQDKARRLTSINENGKALSVKVNQLKENVTRLKADLEALKSEINNLLDNKIELQEKINGFTIDKDFIISNPKYKALSTQIAELEARLSKPVENTDVIDQRQKKTQLETELESITKQLAQKEHNEKFRVRIKELMEEEKSIAQQIAELEKQEFLTEDFIRTKVELLEGSINSKFKYVSFKLFNTLVNGSLEECCEALVNGVPYTTNANTAAKYNAGLDIINTLSDHYGVYAPIFIDGRESVNKLIDTNNQVINLIVSQDKEIRVEVM